MSRTFKIGVADILFTGDIDQFEQVRRILFRSMSEQMDRYKKRYDNYGGAQDVAEREPHVGLRYVDEAFLGFKDVFIRRNVYNFSEDLLHKHSYYKWVKEPFVETCYDFIDAYEEILAKQQGEHERRAYRKATRGRVIGGGFGLSGAVKGMATAGALNMGAGLAHGTWNMIGNALTDISASSDKSDLYKKGREALSGSLESSMMRLQTVLVDMLNIKGVNLDSGKAASILSNIESGAIAGDNVFPAYCEAFKAFPYSIELYKSFIPRFPVCESDVVEMGKFFEIDLEDFLKELHVVNNFYFEDIAAAAIVKPQYKELAGRLDKDMKEGFAQLAHDPQYLVKKNEPVYVRYMLDIYEKLYESNKSNPAVGAYYTHYIDLYKQQLQDIQRIYGKAMAYTEKGYEISRDRLLLESEEIYIGIDRTPEAVRKKLVERIGGKAGENTRIYISINLDPGFVLCNEGMFSLASSPENDKHLDPVKALAFTVEADKGVFSDSINIGGKVFYSNSEVCFGDLRIVTKYIEKYFPAVLFTLVQTRLCTAPSVSDITMLGKCYDKGCGVQQDVNKAMQNYARAALYNEPIAQCLLYSKYLNRGKKQGANAENYLAKAKYWLYAAARNGDETARTCILENRDNINKMRFATVKEAVAGDEFKMAVAEMTQNGYGLSALESDLNKLAALNQFSIKERMFHMMEKERELDEFTTSCYYCYPDIPDSKIGNVLKTYAAGLSLSSKNIWILYDRTFIGSAKDGFVFLDSGILTDRRVYVAYDDIDDIMYEKKQVLVKLKNTDTYSVLYTLNRADNESRALFARVRNIFNQINGRG